jgi:hypothetical protein
MSHPEYYYVGKIEDFPKELNLEYTPAAFDYDTNTVKKVTEQQEKKYDQYIMSGFEHEWLVLHKLKGNRCPIEIKEAEYDSASKTYTVSDKICIKITRAINTYRAENRLYGDE